MRFLRAFGRFWYDFVIGDDWKIAGAVLTVLVVGAVLVSVAALPVAALTVLLGVLMLVAFSVAVVVDLRTKT